MTVKHIWLILLACCICTASSQQTSTPPPIQSYGSAAVSSVLRLDEHVRLYCNIDKLPPIIGQNIPVCIKGLKPAANTKDNLKLLMFLNDLFLSKNNKPKTILLKDIQRGEQFCLVADIEIDGQDLCGLLVAKGLAQKVIEVAAPGQKNPTPDSSSEKKGYIATKSSKVYHRPTCSHAKRIDAGKSVTFSGRQEAEMTGRRPCKTCKP